VLGPAEAVGSTTTGAMLGPGAGDNAAAALGLGVTPGDVVVSIGTSGVVSAVARTAVRDGAGIVAGFADATGLFLPLVCTLNAARVLDAVARMLRVDHARLSDLALSAEPGAGGLVLVPYLEGERTPNLPDATGTLEGLTLANATPADVARAAVEGLLCGLADGMDALVASGVAPRRVLLVGGGAASEAVRRIAPTVLGLPVDAPDPGEYVADGACRQAAWTLSQTAGSQTAGSQTAGSQTAGSQTAGSEIARSEPASPPAWGRVGGRRYEADALPDVRKRYAEARQRAARTSDVPDIQHR
jgi:xylulokinase